MTNRHEFAERIRSGQTTFAPVCLDPLTGRLIESLGFDAAYLSGGGFGFQLAVSEALLTTTEIATLTRQITARSSVPLIVDGGVGFGDAVHLTRAIREIESAGGAAIEIEDQVSPKRAHHHKGVEFLEPLEVMVDKVREAAAARSDPDFLIIARTGAVRNESFESAIERSLAYREAGADVLMIFPTTTRRSPRPASCSAGRSRSWAPRVGRTPRCSGHTGSICRSIPSPARSSRSARCVRPTARSASAARAATRSAT